MILVHLILRWIGVDGRERYIERKRKKKVDRENDKHDIWFDGKGKERHREKWGENEL